MRTLFVRNVHEALPRAVKMLHAIGDARNSRNGPVLVAPWPIMTIYEKPCERVIFWPERDANPFFHLYESLWMLVGRNDVEVLGRYAKRMLTFSDDNRTLHGAYGDRWRKGLGQDQLTLIAKRLKEDSEDRRCVLQIWDSEYDLNIPSKDIPCNLTVTFQRGMLGQLDMTVFCRSNDIIWGAYGANAVHFSMLLEYMAFWIGCSVGTFTLISVNWHGYMETLKTVAILGKSDPRYENNPYVNNQVHHQPIKNSFGSIESLDKFIKYLLEDADSGFTQETSQIFKNFKKEDPCYTWYLMLLAHHEYKTRDAEKYFAAMEILDQGDPKADWIVAGRQWIQRRQMKTMYGNQEQA